jgi:hypothetical protein
MVNGTSYDVTFVDGTCEGVFGACDAAHFNFSTQADADSASSALIASLVGSAFETSPTTISGCETSQTIFPNECFILTPYQIDAEHCFQICTGPWAVASADDVKTTGQSLSDPNSLFLPSDPDLTNTYEDVWAVWSPSGVPEPASWAMMLAGLASIGFVMRRSRVRDALPGASRG